MDDIAKGRFQAGDRRIDQSTAKKVTRVIFCSGKVHYDLLAARREKNITDIAIARLEQLYPFPAEAFQANGGQVPEGYRDRLVPGKSRAHQGAWYWIASQHLDRSFNSRKQRCFSCRVRIAVAGSRLLQQTQRTTKSADRVRTGRDRPAKPARNPEST